jgi:streptogramin lyase
MCLLAVAVLWRPIAFAAPGALLVENVYDNSVLRFDTTSGALTETYPLGVTPGGVVLGDDGFLYVNSIAGTPVRRLDLTSGQIEPFTSGPSAQVSVGLAFGPDTNLYRVSGHVAPNCGVVRYDGESGAFMGPFATVPDGFVQPYDIAFGPDGDIFLCLNFETWSFLGAVLRFDGETGEYLGVFAETPQLETTYHNLEFSPDGDLIVSGNDALYRFDGTSGEYLGQFTEDTDALSFARGFVFAPDGYVYVAEHMSDNILRFDSVTGEFADVFASGVGLNGPASLVYIPEPSTACLLLVGALPVVYRRR